MRPSRKGSERAYELDAVPYEVCVFRYVRFHSACACFRMWGRVVSTPTRVCLSVYLGITNSQSAIDTVCQLPVISVGAGGQRPHTDTLTHVHMSSANKCLLRCSLLVSSLFFCAVLFSSHSLCSSLCSLLASALPFLLLSAWLCSFLSLFLSLPCSALLCSICLHLCSSMLWYSPFCSAPQSYCPGPNCLSARCHIWSQASVVARASQATSAVPAFVRGIAHGGGGP